MRYKTLTVLSAFAAVSHFAFADPIEDARAIVELTETKELYLVAMEALGELMAGNIQNEVRKNGEEMSDAAAQFAAEFVSDIMAEEMTRRVKEPTVLAYVDNFSPEALAAYRQFLETEEGLEVASKIPLMVKEGSVIGEAIGEEVATIAVEKMIVDISEEKWPEGTSSTLKRELRELFSE